ncbi:N-6 DNA methylase [Streptomyces sp. NPDC051018]|uniref:N-6 DNA methylase n=1 Tax=Streptomyces sp. NPDC051018 TaxID=3365639 RepID=UPI0037BA6BED
MADTDMAPASPGPLVSGSEIARLAGVTRAAVSNWRRRYEDFPQPAGGGAGRPLFVLEAVRAWLEKQDKGQEISGKVRLWQSLRAAYGEEMVTGLDALARYLATGERDDSLPGEAVRLADELTAEETSGDSTRASAGNPSSALLTHLVQRLTDSTRRSGSDQVTSERVARAVRHFAGPVAADATVFDPACGIGTLLLSVGAAEPGEPGEPAVPSAAGPVQGTTGGTGRGPAADPEGGPEPDPAERPDPGRKHGSQRAPGHGPDEEQNPDRHPDRAPDPAPGPEQTPGPAPRRIGQESDPHSASLARLRAGLAGRTGVTVTTGDSLRADGWPKLRADLVVCDPPTGGGDWGRESLLLDSRWEFGTPPRAEGELAWLQHGYAHTAPGGRLIMVMPASVAYRKAGRRMRAELVRRGLLTQIVALPAGVAASHSLPVHLWQLRRPRTPGGSLTSVRLIDLTANDPDGPLDPAPGQVTDVPLIDLLDDSVDLTPGRHTAAPHRDYPAEYARLRERLAEQLTRLRTLLPELAEGPGPGSLDGSMVSVAELARAGLVDYGGPQPVSVSDQLDTDYLRGFLLSTANTRRSTSTGGTYRADGRGARVPQLDIGEQRRYGQVFRALQEFEEALRAVSELSRETASLARDGLGNGALSPRTAPVT